MQSVTAAAPLCEVIWKEKQDEFNETKQVREAMKVTCNWNGEHDQKGLLHTQTQGSSVLWNLQAVSP